jgi:hypothetical protein
MVYFHFSVQQAKTQEKSMFELELEDKLKPITQLEGHHTARVLRV